MLWRKVAQEHSSWLAVGRGGCGHSRDKTSSPLGVASCARHTGTSKHIHARTHPTKKRTCASAWQMASLTAGSFEWCLLMVMVSFCMLGGDAVL